MPVSGKSDHRSIASPESIFSLPLCAGLNSKKSAFLRTARQMLLRHSEPRRRYKRVDKSGPPKAQLVGQLQGSSTSRSKRPSGLKQATHAPPATRQFQSRPSASRQEPSGAPRSIGAAKIRLLESAPTLKS